MGKSDLDRQAKELEKVAPKVYLKYDSDIKRNLKGTKQADDYEAAKREYDIDGCADAISDMATELRRISGTLPRHSPKSRPTSRRLKRQGKD